MNHNYQCNHSHPHTPRITNGVSPNRLKLTRSVMLLIFLTSTVTEARPRPSVIKPPGIEKQHTPSSGPPLWRNPCGVDHHGTGPGRHDLKDFLKPLKEQIKLTLSHLKITQKTRMTKVYSPVLNLTKQIHDTKLPQGEFAEYVEFREKHPHMNKKKMTQHMLPKLYVELQTYAIAFEKLLKMRLKTESAKDIKHARKSIFQDIQNYQRALICEVETALNLTQSSFPGSVEMDAFQSERDWPEQSDLTSIYTRDFSTVTEYRNILEDWRKILREIDFIGRPNRPNPASPKTRSGKNIRPNNRRRKNAKKMNNEKNKNIDKPRLGLRKQRIRDRQRRRPKTPQV